MENVGLYLVNLIIVNAILTAVFVKANVMYFADENKCAYA